MEELAEALGVPSPSACEPGDPSSATGPSPPVKQTLSSSKELLDSIPVLPDAPEGDAIAADWGGNVVSELVTAAACEGAAESTAPQPLLLQGPETEEQAMAVDVESQAPLRGAVEAVSPASLKEEGLAVAAELPLSAAHRDAPGQPADGQATLLERQPSLALPIISGPPAAESIVSAEPTVNSAASDSGPGMALAQPSDGEPNASAEVATSGTSQGSEAVAAVGSKPATHGTPASGRKPRSRRPSGAGAAGSTRPLARSRSHPKAPAPVAAAAGPSGGGAGGQEGEDILAELEAQRARHAQQLTHEARAKHELEQVGCVVVVGGWGGGQGRGGGGRSDNTKRPCPASLAGQPASTPLHRAPASCADARPHRKALQE